MIDFSHMEQYRENNRLEAKKAVGGLPNSMWETYSAFANTLGGLILLGVEEYPDHSLHPVDLPDPAAILQDFWSVVNNSDFVSANILRDEDVWIEEIDGKHIVVINVPVAKPEDRPVYVYGDRENGIFLRSGEGDYRVTREIYGLYFGNPAASY